MSGKTPLKEPVPMSAGVTYKRNRQAMLGRFWITITCRTVAPLLVPFSEDTLTERQRGKVLAHLERCENCRGELAGMTALADFLHANPPTPAVPSPDLWARLEAQIQTEAAPAPVRRPARSTAFAQWQSFTRSFLQSGAVVAAVLVMAFVVRENLGTRPATSNRNFRETAITLRVHPASSAAKTAIVRRTAPLASLAGKRMVADASPVAPASAPETAAVVHRMRPRSLARTVVHRVVRPVIPVATSTPETRLVAMAGPRESAPLAEREGTTRSSEHIGEANVVAARPPANALPKTADPEEMIRPAVWMSEESGTVRAGAATETVAALHRQETLFSYGDR